METDHRPNPHGVDIRRDGTICFRLWAPEVDRVRLEISEHAHLRQMTATGDGWHELITDQAMIGSRYRFVLPDGLRVPDPASRFQPEDVHGPSEVIDPSRWVWDDAHWRGRPWHESVVYELHVGAFTPEGTFSGAIAKLDHLVDLGVTAIELMPVGDFPGRWNWGYDSVLPYAPDSSYGRPEDLKALVEAAHARGLMILLDVVYNHFGPDGNYLPVYAPQFFTARHRTPWGAAINFDGPCSGAVREFVIQNAIYWISQFHLDGLRLDAVHAILDDSPKHILQELAERVRSCVPHRQVHLVLENEENEPRWLEGLYTAQWNDDVHHVLHTAATGESQAYYEEYRGDTGKMGRALAEGFVFQGEMMRYRGRPRGGASRHLPPSAFVAFLQNHDQVGNRAFGDRLGPGVAPEVLRATAACYLLLPEIPMLFMGEEWNASQPFPFFCDFPAHLADAVRQGRRDEFARFPEFHDPEKRALIPDPQQEETFRSAKLRWEELTDSTHHSWLDWYRRILAARRQSVQSLIPRIRRGGEFMVLGEGALLVTWQLEPSGQLFLAANLSDARVVAPLVAAGATVKWQEGHFTPNDGRLSPWSVLWAVKEP